jgi:hypothetical protein
LLYVSSDDPNRLNGSTQLVDGHAQSQDQYSKLIPHANGSLAMNVTYIFAPGKARLDGNHGNRRSTGPSCFRIFVKVCLQSQFVQQGKQVQGFRHPVHHVLYEFFRTGCHEKGKYKCHERGLTQVASAQFLHIRRVL